MQGSVTAAFSEIEEFQAAASGPGDLQLVLTGPGRFQARSTEVMLHRLRLLSVEENLARIAFIGVPPDVIMVALPRHDYGVPTVWGGVTAQTNDLVTIGAGQSVHMRTGGRCNWGALWLPQQELEHYAGALTGTATAFPPTVYRWRLASRSNQQLRQLFAAAIRTARNSLPVASDAAAHGLDQQLIQLLVECLSARPANAVGRTMCPGREVMVRLERLIQNRSQGGLDMRQIRSELGVPDRFLRSCCNAHVGMSPMSYVRLHQLQLANRTLRRLASQSLDIAEVAARFGFRSPGRFAKSYRELYGELPSATLRRSLDRGLPEITLHDRAKAASSL